MKKKTTKKNTKNKSNKNAIVAIVVVGIILAGIIYFFNMDTQTPNQLITEENSQEIASVNGQVITMDDIERAKQRLQLRTQSIITNEKAIEQVISEEVMLQEAESQGLSYTFEEAEQHLANEMEKTGQTLEEVKKALNDAGKNYQEEINVYREQISIQKLLDEKTPEAEVTDEEAQQYFEENKDKLFTGETVPYEQIEEQLKIALAQREKQDDITEYIGQLREKATIEYLNQNE